MSIRPKWPLESERDSRFVLKVRLGVRSIGPAEALGGPTV
jgi:hypothetical protein